MQVRQVVPLFRGQLGGRAEPRNVLDVGDEVRRVGVDDAVDEEGEEGVGGFGRVGLLEQA